MATQIQMFMVLVLIEGEWASNNISAVFFEYSTTEDYKREQTHLEKRFQKARTIPGTHKLYFFVPISKDKVRTQVFSSSIISKEEKALCGRVSYQ